LRRGTRAVSLPAMPKATKPPAKAPDLFRPKLIVVFCGLAVRRRPAALKQYYGDPGNRFWSVLAATNLTPRRLAPTEFRLLASFGVGLTDLIKTQAGDETELKFGLVDRAGLRAKILAYQPRFFCFNGKPAAQEFYASDTLAYGIQPEPVDSTNMCVLPSTSGAAGGEWDQGPWDDLAERVRRIRGPVG